MPHAIATRPTRPPRPARQGGGCLLCLALLLGTTGCPADGEGDDLPPGAFTTGGNVEPPATDDGATSTVPGDDATSTVPGATTTSEDTGTTSDLPAMISHAEHILPIWNASCTDAACHDADSPQFGLDMASEGVYDRICTQTHAFSGFSYIDCEGLDPTRSYLFRKLENTHLDGDISGASGAGMPPMPLDEADIALIEAWIVGGALP